MEAGDSQLQGMRPVKAVPEAWDESQRSLGLRSVCVWPFLGESDQVRVPPLTSPTIFYIHRYIRISVSPQTHTHIYHYTYNSVCSVHILLHIVVYIYYMYIRGPEIT